MKWLLIPACTLALCCASVKASRLSEYIASPELRAKLQEGIDDLEAGRFVTLDELEAEFAERRRKRDAA